MRDSVVPNWAIVIGINMYKPPIPSLNAAVNDAKNMRDWLIKKGGVDENNLILLLSPVGTDNVTGLEYKNATQNNILRAIEKIIGKSGDRFFFHFSGHGVGTVINFARRHGIMPEDCTYFARDQINSNLLIETESIYESLKAAPFNEQFFFIDACRNIEWDTPRRIGGATYLPEGDTDNHQFVLFATSHGGATLDQLPDKLQAPFTHSLLKGLQGVGSGKRFNSVTHNYEMKVSSLFEYVRREIETQKNAVEEKNRKFIRLPTKAGESGIDPILATFPEKEFGIVQLEVYTDPPTIFQETEIVVRREHQIGKKPIGATSSPALFKLPPRDYRIEASANAYEPTQEYWVADLWDPQKVTVSLQATRGTTRTIMRGLPTTQWALLLVIADDPEAPLEVADSAGKTLKIGRGTLQYDTLEHGFYIARLKIPEAEPLEQKVHLLPGSNEKVHFIPPKPLRDSALGQELIKKGEFNVGAEDLVGPPPNTLEVSERVGPIVMPDVSTILALAGSAVTYDENIWSAHKLRKFGLSTFKAAVKKDSSGLQVLFSTEFVSEKEALEYLSGIRVRFWPLDSDMPSSSNDISIHGYGVGEFSCAAEPGPHCLSIEVQGQKPVTFALSMLKDRLTLLVFNHNREGNARIFQYSPGLNQEQNRFPVSHGLDQDLRHLRRLDLMQRFYMSSDLGQVRDGAQELLLGKWVDPIAGCLGAYVFLRTNEPGRIDIAARNMREYFGGLSDSHVLLGEYAFRTKATNVPTAEESFRNALENGIPIFSDGLRLLALAVKRYQIDHGRRALLEKIVQNQVKGLLWSAWVSRG